MGTSGAALVGTFGPNSTAELLRVLASPAAARCDLVELRLDYLDDAFDALPILIARAPVPVVATCRRVADGGAFAGDEAERLALLTRAAALGAAWVDVEHDVEAPALGTARLLRSAHVARLPANTADLVATLLAPPAAAGKLVAQGGDEADAVALLALLDEHAGRLAGHVVAQRFSRFASAAVGAPLVYAALRRGGRIGLAMPTVGEMLDGAALRRMRRGTRLWVLLGADVERSVSPQMLNVAFAALGADIVAVRWSCADPRPALDALIRFGWAGAAVTMPHKRGIVEAVEARGGLLAESALEVGAINTVVVVDGALVAHNTDLGGLLAALEPALPEGGIAGRTVIVVGAGGAARAAVRAAYRLGARPVVFAREPAAGRVLAELATVGDEPLVVANDAADAAAAHPAVVVDATPAGPPGGVPFFDPALLPGPAVVMDMLVAARPTALLAAAEREGHATVDGLRMLAHQAARQVGLLTGRAPDVGAMLAEGARLLTAAESPVVLLGLRCSGKTTVAARLAKLTGRRFVDVDVEVERIAHASPEDLIRSGDEAHFRRLEARALAAARWVPASVVATGGGAALSPDALRELCDDAALVVLLDARDDMLLERLGREPRAPLTDLDPVAELGRQRAERMGFYGQLADVVVDTSEASADEIAGELAARLVC